MLRLSEEIIILALNEKLGLFFPLPERALDFALAGALLMQLVYAKHLSTPNENCRVLSFESTAEPVEDFALSLFRNSGPQDTLKSKIYRLAAQGRTIRKMIIKNFVELGILECEKESFCGIVYARKYFLIKPTLKTQIVNRLKALLFEGKKGIERDEVLLNILAASKIYRNAFNEIDIEKARPIFEHLRESSTLPITPLIWSAINETQEAIDSVIASGF